MVSSPDQANKFSIYLQVTNHTGDNTLFGAFSLVLSDYEI